MNYGGTSYEQGERLNTILSGIKTAAQNIVNRLLNLETNVNTLNNNIYEVTYRETINPTGTTTGSITFPTGATLDTDDYPGNAILSTLTQTGEVTGETPIFNNNLVTATLAANGTWVTNSFTNNPVAIIFRLKIKAIDYQNLDQAKIIDSGVIEKEADVIVRSLSDLPSANINGGIQLENNKSYRIKGIINLGANYIIAGVSNTIYGFDKSDDGFIYTGSVNAFEVTNQTLSVVNLFLRGTGGGVSQLFSVNNNTAFSFQVRECIISGNCQAGTINGGNIIAINNNIHSVDLTYGWDTKGTINKCGIDSNYFENPNTTEHVHLEEGSFNSIKITNNDFSINTPNPAILVDNTVTINNQGAGLIVGNTFTGSGQFVAGIDATTLQWILEDNGRRVLNTSDTLTQKKVRSEAELDLYLAEPDPTIYSFLIDSKNFILTKPINVPGGGVNGGLTFFGLGNNFTTISISVAQPMFIGGGNLFLNDMIVSANTSGSSVFGMTSSTGFEAVEMVNINFQSCESLGYLEGFRQGLIINGFMINDKQGLEFRGTWSGGFRIDSSRFIFTPTVGSYMFRSAIGHTFGDRFITNANSTIGTGSIGYDFREDTFIKDASFQIIDANFSGIGTYVNGITASSIKSLWRDSPGVDDTFQGCVYKNTTDTLTDIISTGTWVELAVNNDVTEDTWFASQSSSTFHTQYLSSLPINIRIDLILALQSGNNHQLQVEIRQYNSTNTSFTEVDRFTMTSNGGTLGTRVEPISLAVFTRITQNERIRVFVRNISGNTDVLCEPSSKLIISKR